MTDVSLNSGIRSNLLQLQRSSAAFQTTTERLASGKKVNSAIDNPSNFFAAVNLTDRAEGLSSRLDGIGQAVQTVKAADNGISTIRSFVSAMKGVVNNALGNTDESARADLGRQFNELLVQVGSNRERLELPRGQPPTRRRDPTRFSSAKNSMRPHWTLKALT